MMTGKTIFFVNMYIVVNTDLIVEKLRERNNLNFDPLVLCFIMLLGASLVDIRDTKLNIAFYKFAMF